MICSRRLALVLMLLGFSRMALAQSGPAIINQWTSGSSGSFNVQWSNPNVNSPQMIACSPVSGNRCFLLNQAACSHAPVPLTFTASPMGGQVPTPNNAQNIYIWGLLNQTCSTGYAGSATNNPNPNSIGGSYLIGLETNVYQTFMNPGGQGMSFPGNVPYVGGLDANGKAGGTSNPALYTHLDLMNQYLLCNPGSGQNLSTFYLCIGVDGNGSGCVGQACGVAGGTTTTTVGTGTGTSSGDYIAWAQVQIDTLPPSPPTINNPKPLNGRVRFNVVYDSNSLDTYTINIYSSSDPGNVALAQAAINDTTQPGCAGWTDNYFLQSEGVQPQKGTLPMTINGTNNVTYAYCAQAQDYLHNVSTLSSPVILTPQFECDLFDCYPGDLQTGFCGAGLPPEWFALPFGAVAWRRRKRRL